MEWRDIPSLPALRAFEAAARNRNLTHAATELNVTQAAVAQHVRALEKDFGLALLTRAGRGMDPTPAGAQLAAALADGFGTIAGAVHDLRRATLDRPLAITSTYTFTETWLMPRLPAFWAAHPDVPLSINASTRLVDLRRDGFDLAIRCGSGQWPGLRAELIAPTDHVVVATPGLVPDHRIDSLVDLADQIWLFDAIHAEAENWLAAQGLPMDRIARKELPAMSLILPALRAGGGVAAIGRAIVHDDLRSGRLVKLFEGDGTGPGYYLVSAPGVAHPGARIFRRWLLKQAQA